MKKADRTADLTFHFFTISGIRLPVSIKSFPVSGIRFPISVFIYGFRYPVSDLRFYFRSPISDLRFPQPQAYSIYQ